MIQSPGHTIGMYIEYCGYNIIYQYIHVSRANAINYHHFSTLFRYADGPD